MGTSIGKAIDWLVATLPVPVQETDSAAIVADGWPLIDAASYVVIGAEDPDIAPVVDGKQQQLILGMGSTDEDYNIPCYVWVKRPGPAFKPARDAAIALFDTVAHTIASDRTLGGALLGGRFAQIEKVVLNQTEDNESTGTLLMVCSMSFDIRCASHYVP